MSELTQATSTVLAVPKYADEKAFATLVNAGKFLPRLQLFDSNSNLVKEGKITGGHYAIMTGKDSFTVVGKDVQCHVLTWRFKAVRFGDETITKYNPNDPEFQKIVVESEEKDQGAMAGIEFLLHIPDMKKYVTFFMGNKSSKREAPNLRALIGQQATLSSKFIKYRKYSWWGPVISTCSTPLDPFDLEEAKEIAERFCNPKETETESASAGEVASQERDQ